MSAPSLKLQMPPRALFNWPPDPLPIAIPPPRDARTFASPFPIPGHIFNAVLDWKVPVTIGAIYASTAIIANKVNRDRKNQPWGFSKTKSFYYFVLAHNMFLAVFSALTFVGMIRALAHTWPGRRDLPFLGKLWPGLRTQNGLAGAADALCKLHGPRDLGDAVFYNPASHGWVATNRAVKLSGGAPDASDVGRLWNEGLAFWGWWFYLSKFYEVLDTFIILAKGKRSSTLQTYHHTGAMACMWAGIRYMSPPIWMFCFINSGIHTLMYTYYTLSALHIRVPQGIKRTLTTMQITQFLVGITFATLHLFVHYSVPVEMPFTKTVHSAAAVASSAVSSAASVAASKGPEVAAGLGATIQKILLRGAGEEGMAQKVGQSGQSQVPAMNSNATDSSSSSRQETQWRTQYEYIPCIDTEGQAFAIWLNVFYLAPLTVLFVRFFVRSYLRRGAPNTKHSRPSARISKAAEDAAHGVDREVDTLGKAAEKGVGELANNVMNKLHGSNAKNNSQRRVSANIERIANNFEKAEEQDIDAQGVETSSPGGGNSSNNSSIRTKGSNESLRVGQMRKKASAEHNKLRQMFEAGPQSFGRSVESSPKAGSAKVASGTECQSDKLSPCVEDEDAEVEKVKQLQGEAEAKVKNAREAAGGQGPRSVEDMVGSSAADSVNDKESASMEQSRFSQTDFSLIDVRQEQNEEHGHDGNTAAPETPKSKSAKGPQMSEDVDPQLDGDNDIERASSTSSRASRGFQQVSDGADDSVPAVPISSKQPDFPSATESGRSPSPKRPKSKIPQLAGKRSSSPTKKTLNPGSVSASLSSSSSVHEGKS